LGGYLRSWGIWRKPDLAFTWKVEAAKAPIVCGDKLPEGCWGYELNSTAIARSVEGHRAGAGALAQRQRLHKAFRRDPHYIESFFLEAFSQLGGTARQREARLYEVTHVPAPVRNRDRMIGIGEPVLPRYERIVFEKSLTAFATADGGWFLPQVPRHVLQHRFQCSVVELTSASASASAARRWERGRGRGSTARSATHPANERRTHCGGAPRIHSELLMLGIEVAESTVGRYMPRKRQPPSQGWKTFL
jgi:hypothetical protein